MALWRNKTLLAVGACAGVAIAVYCAVRQIPKFLWDDEHDSGNQTPVSGKSFVMEHSQEVMDSETTPPSQGVMAAEATLPSVGVMSAEATPLSLKLHATDAEATPCSLTVKDKESMPLSLEVKGTEATPSSQNVDTEITPCTLEMRSVDTPTLAESVTSVATPSSLDSVDTVATPSSLDSVDTVATPSSLDSVDTEATPSSLVSPGVVCELVDDFTELHKHYEVYETIGSGSFGKVHLGKHLLTGEMVAIKVMEKKEVSDALWREIDAMANLHHQHVCQLYHVIETPNLILLVLEYCPGGELFDHIAENEGFNEMEARRLFRQIVSALAYIHSQGYAHRDLKPENLLLDEHYNIKLIDFGLCAKPEGGLDSLLTTFCGSPCYAAPELFQGKPYIGSAADVWSLGVVLFSMLCGYLPFGDKSFNVLRRQIMRGQFNIPDWLSLESVLLLKQMLQVDPKRRVTVDRLLDHQWVMKGYSSPVEWHSTRLIHHLDRECIYVMAVLLNRSELSTIQLVSEWQYDNNTATYLLFLAKRQRLSAAHNTPDVAAQNSTFFPVDNIHVPLKKCISW